MHPDVASADRAVEVQEDGRRDEIEGNRTAGHPTDRTGAAPVESRRSRLDSHPADQGDDMPMERREFLRRAGLIGSAAVAATALPGCRRILDGPFGAILGGPGMLEFPAAESGIDHVVVVMMENRSFDHWLGWLAEDAAFLEVGRQRYGKDFFVDGNQHQTFPSPTGPVATTHLVGAPNQPSPYQGCGFKDPGHSWTEGRAQRDGGFLAPGSDNDVFATGYYLGDDLPFTSEFARSFTTFDRYHASLLAPTYPNRHYMHSAQSGGIKTNALPPEGGFTWDTIWDRLTAAGVPARMYYSDLPFLALYADHLSYLYPATDYYTDCAAGTLPNVSFLDPRFVGPEQNDDHPYADIRRGQEFVREAFRAFAQSPNWKNGLFIVTYDEWGGFFDHVAPPHFADDLTSTVDADDFSQSGFRVPTIMASPFAQPNFVDHRAYEHSSILRFLEWRFLGAPPEGPGGNPSWFLTARDRNANNIGASLRAQRVADDIGFDLNLTIPPPAPLCEPEVAALGAAAGAEPADTSMQTALDSGIFERMGAKVLT
jgi:phospholipase C